MEKQFQHLSLTTEGRAARIQFRRPPLNIFTLPLLTDLKEALHVVQKNSEVHAVIFSSTGSKAFSAGVAVQDHYPRTAPKLFKTFHATFRTLWSWNKLSVAEVDGYCLGGGCELALSCDLAVASTRAVFGFPEITVGCFPPIGLIRLPSAIGLPRATEYLLSGKRFTSQEAMALGLINRRVPATQLKLTTTNLLKPIFNQSLKVIQKTIEVLRLHTKPLIQSISISERTYLNDLLNTHDAIEGLDAFLQKRPPIWQNK